MEIISQSKLLEHLQRQNSGGIFSSDSLSNAVDAELVRNLVEIEGSANLDSKGAAAIEFGCLWHVLYSY